MALLKVDNLNFDSNKVRKVRFVKNGVVVSDDVLKVVYNNSGVKTTVFEKEEDKLLVAVGSAAVYYSEDAGDTWNQGYYSAAAITTCDTVIYDPVSEYFIAYSTGYNKSYSKYIYYSKDGKDWKRIQMANHVKKVFTDSYTESGTVYDAIYIQDYYGYIYFGDIENDTLAYIRISATTYNMFQDYVTKSIYLTREKSVCRYKPVDGVIVTVKVVSTDNPVFGYIMGVCNNLVFALTDDGDEDNTYYQIEWSKLSTTGGPLDWIETQDTCANFHGYMGNGQMWFQPKSSSGWDDPFYYVTTTGYETYSTYGSASVDVRIIYGCEPSNIDGYFYYPQYKDLRRNTSLTSSSAPVVLGLGKDSRHVYQVTKWYGKLLAPSNYGIWKSDDGATWTCKSANPVVYKIVGKSED